MADYEKKFEEMQKLLDEKDEEIADLSHQLKDKVQTEKTSYKMTPATSHVEIMDLINQDETIKVRESFSLDDYLNAQYLNVEVQNIGSVLTTNNREMDS